MLQVTLNLVAGHLHHKELVLKRIDGEQVVVPDDAGLHVSVEGEWGCERDFSRLAADAERMDQIQVVAHAPVGVAGPEVRVQDAHFPQGESLDGLVVLLEMGPHRGVGLVGPDRDGLGLVGTTDDLVILDRQVQLSLGDVPAVAAGIEEHVVLIGLHIRPVVVARQDEVHALDHLEDIQPLGLQHAAVARTRPRVHHHDQHVRLFFRPDGVHIGLDLVHDRLEMHPAPEFLREPGLHIRIRVTQDGHLQARPLDDLVGREIRLAVIVPDGIRRQEIDPGLLEIRRHAVVHRMARLDVVIAHGHRVIAHIRHQAREQVRRQRIDIVVVIRRIVALEAVASVDEEDILRPVRRPDAVHIILHRHQRRPRPAVHIGGVEPRPVDIVGGKHRQGIFPVLEGTAAGEGEKGAGCEEVISECHNHRFNKQRYAKNMYFCFHETPDPCHAGPGAGVHLVQRPDRRRGQLFCR